MKEKRSEKIEVEKTLGIFPTDFEVIESERGVDKVLVRTLLDGKGVACHINLTYGPGDYIIYFPDGKVEYAESVHSEDIDFSKLSKNERYVPIPNATSDGFLIETCLPEEDMRSGFGNRDTSIVSVRRAAKELRSLKGEITDGLIADKLDEIYAELQQKE